MREVQGYFFKADFGRISPLFGISVNLPEIPYENIVTNDFTPFDSLEQLNKVRMQYQRVMSSCLRTIPISLSLKIGETDEEMEKQFFNESNLIVLMINEEFTLVETHMLGPVMQGRPAFGVIPGAFLHSNGYVPFTKQNSKGITTAYERAHYLASEINRQAQCQARIAKFKMTEIK